MRRLNNGFSVVEVMLAVSLFTIFATGLVVAILYGLDNNRLGAEQTIANQYAADGLELARNQGFFGVAGGSSSFDKYSRTVAVSVINSNTKKVTSTVTWNFTQNRNNSVVLTTYLTNWKVCLTINTAGANRNKKVLQGITLSNTCSTAITLTNLKPTWTPTGNNITSVQINGTNIWTSGGVGSPSGNQASGTVLTLAPFVIAANASAIPISNFQMSGNISPGTNWTLMFTMSDTSTSSASFTTP
jgi:Tfp pilus assembly protein PilV